MAANTAKAEVEKTEEASAPVENTVQKSDKDVLYRGNATRRVISVEDWASLPKPIEGQHREWDMLKNNYRIPLEDFSNEEVAYLKTDGGFTLVDKIVPEEE